MDINEIDTRDIAKKTIELRPKVEKLIKPTVIIGIIAFVLLGILINFESLLTGLGITESNNNNIFINVGSVIAIIYAIFVFVVIFKYIMVNILATVYCSKKYVVVLLFDVACLFTTISFFFIVIVGFIQGAIDNVEDVKIMLSMGASLGIILFLNIMLPNYLCLERVKVKEHKILFNDIKKIKSKEQIEEYEKLVNEYVLNNNKDELIGLLEREKNNVILLKQYGHSLNWLKTERLSYQYDSELLEMLVDPDNVNDIHIDNGEIAFDCSQIFTVNYKGKIACILKPINEVEGVKEDEAIAFLLEENTNTGEHRLFVMNDEESKEVFERYYHRLDEEETIRVINSRIDEEEKENEKKSYLVSTICMGVLYACIIVIGILCLTQVLGGFFANSFYSSVDEIVREDIGNVASISIGWIFLSFIPTIGYYFAFNKLYDLSKKPRILIFLGSLLLSIGMVITFMIIYNCEQEDLFGASYKEFIDELDNSGYEHIITIFVSHIGLLITYLLTFVKIDVRTLQISKEKFKGTKDDNPKDTRLLTVIIAYSKQFLKLIMRFFIGLVQIIIALRDKSKSAYFLIMTILFTVLCYIMAFISIVIIIGIIISLIVLFISGAFRWLGVDDYEIYEIEVNGETRILKYNSSYNGVAEYIDNVGDYWKTNDNGSTFYRA